ncbi:MAG: hypothetical protein KKB50_04025 [Planctomycetes bacterium]|nr:hypothetical protein [Planctomycetota bacterium]
MMRILLAPALILALAVPALADCKACSVAKIDGGWCDGCGAGYVAGVKIGSKKLYDALAAKEIKADAMSCKGCKGAYDKNGQCGHCQVGFVDKQAYRSRVAYHLALGQAKDPAKIKCDSCKLAAKSHGWCGGCQVGLAGNRAYKDKQEYESAVKAHEILVAAAKAAEKCEACAVAMVTDGKCQAHDLKFADGKPETEKSKSKAQP